MQKRVLLAGLFHETHTFLEGTTALAEFAVRRGEELLAARGDGSPLAGVLQVADGAGWSVLPTIDYRATPSAIVEDSVFESFWEEFRQAAIPQLDAGIDGIYLVLHGAMATQSIRDIEGELLSRIRSLPGASDLPICGVLDLHGNISERMTVLSQGFVAYQCNPHSDAHAAAVAGAELLDRIMTTGQKAVAVWEHPPIIWPPTGTGTADDPMRTLEAMARVIEASDPDIAAVNIFGGFSFADTPDTGVSFSAVTFGDPQVAREHLRRLTQWAAENRELGNIVDPPLNEVLSNIRNHVASGETPVVIVEPADNIGGGASGDATTVLRALLNERIADSAVVINDPESVRIASSRRIGERVTLNIGGKGSRLIDGPVSLEVELVSTSDGRFDLEDRNSHLASMYGIHIDMGPCAVVRSGGVTILLTSRKTPPFDLGQLRSQGIAPERLSVIGVKAAVAHRRAYEKIQRASYTVSTPGPCSSDVRSFPYQHVRRPIFPIDQ